MPIRRSSSKKSKNRQETHPSWIGSPSSSARNVHPTLPPCRPINFSESIDELREINPNGSILDRPITQHQTQDPTWDLYSKDCDGAHTPREFVFDADELLDLLESDSDWLTIDNFEPIFPDRSSDQALDSLQYSETFSDHAQCYPGSLTPNFNSPQSGHDKQQSDDDQDPQIIQNFLENFFNGMDGPDAIYPLSCDQQPCEDAPFRRLTSLHTDGCFSSDRSSSEDPSGATNLPTGSNSV